MSRFDSSMRLPNGNSEDIAAYQQGPADDFFKSVRMGCFPTTDAKAQPWKNIWTGPTPPSADGELLVACPKNCLWGRFNFLPEHPWSVD
jgi:hypothetical protein